MTNHNAVVIPMNTISATSMCRQPRRPQRCRLGAAAFAMGDLLFLACVGAAGAVVMHAAHMAMWPFVLMALLGMAAAMVLQIVLAFAVAPILGSIESAVPSMLVAMTAPMIVCASHLTWREPTWPEAGAAGSVIGAVIWLWLLAYSARCRSLLGRPVQEHR